MQTMADTKMRRETEELRWGLWSAAFGWGGLGGDVVTRPERSDGCLRDA